MLDQQTIRRNWNNLKPFLSKISPSIPIMWTITMIFSWLNKINQMTAIRTFLKMTKNSLVMTKMELSLMEEKNLINIFEKFMEKD